MKKQRGYMGGGMKFGDIVLALRGRDEGRYFVVTGVGEAGAKDSPYVYIADGKTRSAEKPKKKKFKHLRFIRKLTSKELALIESKLTNSNLRKILAAAFEGEE